MTRDRPPHCAPDSEPPAVTDRTDLRAIFDSMGELVMVRDCSGRLTEVNQAFLDAFGGARPDWTGRWFASALGSQKLGESRRYDVAMATRRGEAWIEWTETPLEGGGTVSVGRDVTQERRARAALSEAARGKSVFFAAITHELRTPLSGALGAARLLRDTRLQPDQAAYLDAVTSSAEHALSLIDDILDLSRLEAGRLELRQEPVDLRALIEDLSEVLATRAAEKDLSLAHAIDPDVPARITADPARLKQVLFNLAGNAVKFTETGGVLIRAERANDMVRLSVTDTGPGIAQEDRNTLFEQFERGAAERSHAPGAGLGLAMVKRLSEAMGGEVGFTSEPGKGSHFWFAFPILEEVPATLDPCLTGRHVFVASPCAIQRQAIALQATALGARTSPIADPDAIADCLSQAKGAAVLVLDEAWAAHAAALRAAQDPIRVLALARPSTKDQFTTDQRPEGIDGWLVAPVRARSLAEYACRTAPSALTSGRPGPVPPPLAAPRPDGRLAGYTILVAEDDPVNGLIGERILARLGARPVRVADGQAAVDAVSEQVFDAVLLDLRMPRLDGREAARRIRALPNGRTVPILALTANATEADRAECLDAGMDEFLSKPLDQERLCDALARLCPRENRARVG